MKKSSIPSFLCALFLVSFVSGGFVEEASARKYETKGRVVKKVKTPDMIAPDASADDGSGWKVIDWGRGKVRVTNQKRGIRNFVTVYFFRDLENFTCRLYRAKNGKPGGGAVSLPKEFLGVGFHKFYAWTRPGKINLRCQESDSMPLTLDEVKAMEKLMEQSQGKGNDNNREQP